VETLDLMDSRDNQDPGETQELSVLQGRLVAEVLLDPRERLEMLELPANQVLQVNRVTKEHKELLEHRVPKDSLDQLGLLDNQDQVDLMDPLVFKGLKEMLERRETQDLMEQQDQRVREVQMVSQEPLVSLELLDRWVLQGTPVVRAILVHKDHQDQMVKPVNKDLVVTLDHKDP